jgi:hypothetical protein
VFFNKLYSCFSDEVGQVFYSYLLEIDISNFDSQAYPMSKAKLDSFSKRLDSVYKFLKDTFILGKKDIKRQTVQELYDGYIAYCNKFQIKFKNKIDFNNVLADVNIKWKKSNGQNVYNITYEELNKISNKFHWVHELDEYRNCENDEEEDYDYDVDKMDKSVNVNLLFTQKIEILEDENDDMRRYIKQLEKYVYELEEKEENKMLPIIDDDIIENKVLLEDSRENNHNTVTSEELRFVERFNNTKDFSNNWEKNLEKVKVIEKKLRENEKIALESICLFPKKIKNDDDNKNIKSSKPKDLTQISDDFIPLSDNTFLNKKTNKTYELANDSEIEFDGNLF